jgi:hypothetical protein
VCTFTYRYRSRNRRKKRGGTQTTDKELTSEAALSRDLLGPVHLRNEALTSADKVRRLVAEEGQEAREVLCRRDNGMRSKSGKKRERD